jgi:hypothetical protein
MKHPSSFLAVVLCASLACSVDDSDDVADTNPADASESADATETGTADETETGGGPQDFPPVPCEEVTCAEGDLCVEAGAFCDYTNSGTAEYVYPDGMCMPFPSECEDLQEDPLKECLWMTVCEAKGEYPETVTFEQGFVDCPSIDFECHP